MFHKNILLCRKSLCIALLLLLLLACWGCQETPQEDIVVNKSGGILEERILAEVSDRDFAKEMLASLPERWTENMALQDNAVDIVFDAALKYPEVERIAVIEVAPAGVDLETVAYVMTHMTENGYFGMTEQDPTGGRIRTKSDVMRDIAYEQSLIDDFDINHPIENKDLEPEYHEPGAKEVYIEARAARIEMFMAELESAAADEPQQLELANLPKGQLIYSHLYSKENRLLANFDFVMNPEDERESYFALCGTETIGYLPYTDGPITSQEQAAPYAEQVMQELGLAAQYQLTDSYFDFAADSFAFMYRPVYGGLVMAPMTDYNLYENGYRMSWMEDFILVAFNKNESVLGGVVWYGHTKEITNLNENVELLSFSKIQEQLRKDFTTAFSALRWLDPEIDHTRIEVEEMSLGYRRIPIKNTADRYMLVPTWTLTGTIVTLKKGESTADREPIVLMVINAIDGALVYKWDPYR